MEDYAPESIVNVVLRYRHNLAKHIEELLKEPEFEKVVYVRELIAILKGEKK